jgi:very-short-patch-repair endonuclease
VTIDEGQTSAVAHLFEFLRDVQRLRVKPVLTVAEYTAAGGLLVDLETLPTDHGVSITGLRAPDSSVPALVVPRIPTTVAPEPPNEIKPWLTGDWHSPSGSPSLVASLSFPDVTSDRTGPLDVHEESLQDHPEVSDTFASWQTLWTAWADHEKSTKPTRDLYQRLYVARETIAAAAQDWELVLGVGRLRWSPADRHVLVQPVRVDLDEVSGALSVVREDVFFVEQDMLSPQQLPGADVTSALGGELDALFDDDMLSERLTAYVNRLDARGAFGDRPSDPAAPWMRMAPAVILRKRSRLGLVDALDQIAQYLLQADEVPEGLLPLVDPDAIEGHVSEERPREDGAVYWQDADYFLPLPVNPQQFEVIRRVDYQPLTLVQGPPGTGKTHTTAALISHLLAQGKRVLVTAQTDQALHEVRDKLPAEIQDLAVAVLGTSQAERALLTRSVSVIAERAHHHGRSSADQELQAMRQSLAHVGERRASARKHLLELREADVAAHTIGPYRGTRAQIAEQADRNREQYSWTLELLGDDLTESSPLKPAEWRQLLRLLRDPSFDESHDALSFVLPDVDALPTRGEFAALVSRAATATQDVERLSPSRTNPAYPALAARDSSALTALAGDVAAISTTMQVWADRNEPWIAECLDAIATEKTASWESRKASIEARLADAERLTAVMGDEHDVSPGSTAIGDAKVMAQTVLEFVSAGGQIKTDPLGRPKLGVFSSKTLKACAPLFATAVVDGRPPVTETALARLIARLQLEELLSALDLAWPSTVIPPEDTLAERLAWHRTELDLLVKVLAFGTQADELTSRLRELGAPDIDWRSGEQVEHLLSTVQLIAAEREQAAAVHPLDEHENALLALDTALEPSPLARELAGAIQARAIDGYGLALQEAARLTSLQRERDRRDALASTVSQAAPELGSLLRADALNDIWKSRVETLEEAWQWRRAIGWITQSRPDNLNRLQLSIRADEDRMRSLVGQIAAHLAWTKSVGRLKQSQIADLVQYTQLVKKLGKGTGKYAGRQQAQIRTVLTRCTDSVPVWIVPLHRVATQFNISPELFDVVIIDEASQAGLEATFLQFLGKRIVVVGDDKQVSPTVIVDHSSVHQLAAHHLADSPYAATWSDPQRSLFDEARAKYHDLITLVEHRRCVPDIIGFSNEIAYEPDGIRLIPVRETGSSAFDPVVPVFVPEGYVEGSSTTRRNPPEARSVVKAIKAAIADPRYDGKTMGVISLLGDAQARLIETMLLDEVGPLEISKRQLRCGVASTFQGSERDIIFLSMVAATDEDNRFAAQTKETAVQRYNVAVSRAKDQLWVFHSESLSSLTNPEDLRRRLLEYANRVVQRRGSGVPGASQDLVPSDVLVAPFDSLFEQRVHNRIYERGYIVVPQYEALQYRIDLVVVGERGKFAIECDGDNWHGPEQYMADLARQRELERCGWSFFRVRESDFVVDPSGSLEALWPLLDALDTPTASDRAVSVPETSNALLSPGDSTTLDEYPVTETAGVTVSEPEALEAPGDPVFALRQDDGATSAGFNIAASTQSALPGTAVVEEPTLDELGTGTEDAEWSLDLSDEDDPVSQSASSSLDAGYPWLAPYPVWNPGRLMTPTAEASIKDLQKALVEMIEVEGPVLGVRVMQNYVRASAGLRVGKQIAERLSRALRSAEQDGLIVVDNPTRTNNRMQLTFRTPSQRPVNLRVRGPRSLYDIPHAELRETMGRLADEAGSTDALPLRAIREAYDMSRLEEKATAHLIRVMKLPRPSASEIG